MCCLARRCTPLQPGDSLYALALSSNLTVADIVKVNAGLTPTSTLSIGQQLRLPPWPVECLYGNLTVVPAPAPSPVPATPAPAADCGSEVLELTLQLTGGWEGLWCLPVGVQAAGRLPVDDGASGKRGSRSPCPS